MEKRKKGGRKTCIYSRNVEIYKGEKSFQLYVVKPNEKVARVELINSPKTKELMTLHKNKKNRVGETPNNEGGRKC
jgi:hypothetical protein